MCGECDSCPGSVVDPPLDTRGSGTYQHEIHVTVHPKPGALPPQFDAMCRSLGFRGHVMDIILPGGGFRRDWMTGLSTISTDRAAVWGLVEHGIELEELGWDPIRVKIETVPWHPLAPVAPGSVMPAQAYWESHISAWLADDEIDLAMDLVEAVGGYVSLNALREPRMRRGVRQRRASLTVRSMTRLRGEQDQQVRLLRDQLRYSQIEVENNHRTEFTWLDQAHETDAYGGPPRAQHS